MGYRISAESERLGGDVAMGCVDINASVNGVRIQRTVKSRQSLADFLREELELTGTHIGCEHGICGACSVVLDGDVVRSCLCLAAQIDGKCVETIEGLSDRGELQALQTAFRERNAAQCGFCTPGMLLTGYELLNRTTRPSRSEIRDYISGNFCRCTGYQAIVDAIEATAANDSSGSA